MEMTESILRNNENGKRVRSVHLWHPSKHVSFECNSRKSQVDLSFPLQTSIEYSISDIVSFFYNKWQPKWNQNNSAFILKLWKVGNSNIQAKNTSVEVASTEYLFV